MSDPNTTMPIQGRMRNQRPGCVPASVYMAAYEVYAQVCGPQEAMITGDCRGGFGVGELVAFLYARSFPRDEWAARMNEAFDGANLNS